jgi:hypothetical protein
VIDTEHAPARIISFELLSTETNKRVITHSDIGGRHGRNARHANDIDAACASPMIRNDTNQPTNDHISQSSQTKTKQQQDQTTRRRWKGGDEARASKSDGPDEGAPRTHPQIGLEQQPALQSPFIAITRVSAWCNVVRVLDPTQQNGDENECAMLIDTHRRRSHAQSHQSTHRPCRSSCVKLTMWHRKDVCSMRRSFVLDYRIDL